MWFDKSEPQRKFEAGIFGFNPWSFSYHLEPDGFRELFDLRGPRAEHYENLVPRTVEVAEKLYERIVQRRAWGTQTAPGRWVFERLDAEIKTKHGTRRGNAFTVRDLLKHLTGRSGFARGTTDLPEQFYTWREEHGWLPNFVPNLRLDIDLDRAWFAEDQSEVLRELASQRRVIQAAGLPYRVFRTGSRGVQVVIPLPLTVPPCLASAMMHGIRSALEERGRGFTNPDKDNLHSLMRLPGGVHASSGNLGLWIDMDAACLYPLDTQAEMMSTGFLFPEDDPTVILKDTFQRAGGSMLNRITQSGVQMHELLDRDTAMLHILARISNPITLAIERAHEEALSIRAERQTVIDEWRQTWQAPKPPATDTPEVGGNTSEIAEMILEGNEEAAEAQADESAPEGTMEWAKAVWLEAYPQGGHWDWVNMGGKKGILAAIILFGADQAEEAMLTLSRNIGARSATELREREYTIRLLWEKFGWKNFTTYEDLEHFKPPLILGPTSPEIEELAERILAQMIAIKTKPRWSTTLAERLAIILLIGIRDSEMGRVRASFGTLAETINERWPETKTNRQRVSEMIPRVTKGKDCIVRAFFKSKGNRWKSEADEYSCGSFLKGTPLYQDSSRKQAEILKQQSVEFAEDDPYLLEDIPNHLEVTSENLKWDGGEDNDQ